MKKFLNNFTRYIKVKVKRNAYNIEIIKKLRHKNFVRRNEHNKKLHNFVMAADFIKAHPECGAIYENVENYDINLYELSDAYISCANNCAFVQKILDGKMYTLMESLGIFARMSEVDFKKPIDLKQNNHVEVDEIYLLCFINGDNYWHYTFDIMPRLLLILKKGFSGKFLVNDTGYVKLFSELLRIPEERFILNKPGMIIHAQKIWLCGELYGISLRGKLLADTRNFIISEAEKTFGPMDDPAYPKRIYVSRVWRRKIINEQEIINYLQTIGFEIIVPENLSVYQQMKLFHNADIIVTPHGANSTNLLYAKKGATFVECFSHMWINPCMINTIALLNIDYHMVCERLGDYEENSSKYSDYIINQFILENIIKKILETRALLAKLSS